MLSRKERLGEEKVELELERDQDGGEGGLIGGGEGGLMMGQV